jgi:hypothetical protein
MIWFLIKLISLIISLTHCVYPPGFGAHRIGQGVCRPAAAFNVYKSLNPLTTQPSSSLIFSQTFPYYLSRDEAEG